MANFETKTIKQVFDGLMAKYTALRNKYGDTSPVLEKAAVKSIFYAISGAMGTLWQLSVWIYKQCFPQTCGLPALKFWGSLAGVEFKEGVCTNLIVKLVEVSAASLSAGTVYKDLVTGLIFKTVSQVSAENGEIVTTVECSTPGAVGNLAPGTVLNIANPLDGIPSTATVESVSIEGTEDEGVEDYRKRVLFRFRNKSQCGSMLDYFTWATEVSGIIDALPYVLESGIIKIFLVATGSSNKRSPSGELAPNPFPVWTAGQFTPLTGSGQLLEVANSIEGSEPGVHDRRPVKAKVELSAPNYTAFKVEIVGLTDTGYNDAIKNALIEALDEKRPHIVVLDYPESNAKINKLSLSAACSAVIENETFTTFVLRNSNGSSIDEATLGIGCLAYLSELTINGEPVELDLA